MTIYNPPSTATLDHKLSVSSTDTTPDFLISKIVNGTNTTVVKNNDGGNETIQINVPSPDLSAYLKLDQTTPQSIINGTPIIHSIDGSSAANGNLTLQGTSNSTRTTSYVLLQPNGGNVGIGTTTLTSLLNIGGDTSITGALSVNGNSLASGASIFSTPGNAFPVNGVGIYKSSYAPVTVFGGNYSDAKGVVTIYNRGGVSGFIGLVLKADSGYGGGSLMEAQSAAGTVGFKIDNNGNPLFPNYGYQFGDQTYPGSYGTNLSMLQVVSKYTNAVGLNVVGAVGQSAPLLQVTSTTNKSGTDRGDVITVLASGYVGIGTSTPIQALSVVGSAQFTAVGSGAMANDLRITADGTLTTNTSDQRLKDNILTLGTSTLDKVMQLKPISFTWKGDTSGVRDLGFIAQEVQPLFPETVFQNSTDGYYGINYSRFPAILTKAIQELNEKIDAMASSTASSTSIAGIPNASLVAAVSSALSSVTDWVGQKITATLAVFDTVQVNKGLEIKDSNGSGDLWNNSGVINIV